MLKCLGGRRTPHQLVLLGLKGAGKTTLLYRLKIPTWQDITRDVKRAEKDSDWGTCYNYEEFSGTWLKTYGIWDVPGADAMIGMWPTFYRYICVTATIFVVDGSIQGAEDDEMLKKANRQLRYLLNEDELRSTAFILVINERRERAESRQGGRRLRRRSRKPSKGETVQDAPTSPADATSSPQDMNVARDPREPSTRAGQAVHMKLNVPELSGQAWNRDRFRVFFLDCSDPSREWKVVIEEIQKVHIRMGGDDR
mmetsp:Transcript_27362/g.78839  ORF Transcript_27362/g.78839 Transcript_27362/m.78839 type:complete len:254 (-) Transcript_27362:104-865(-)